MKLFSRNSHSILSNWWWTVDKPMLGMVSGLMILGIFLTFSASPSVAQRVGQSSYHYIYRQCIFVPLAFLLMIFLSMQNLKFIRRFASIGYILAILLTVMTLFWGQEIKGAHRWIRILGFSLQPSEFIKPTFAIVAAWLFDAQRQYSEVPGTILSTGLFIFTAGLLLSQPDIGMTFVVGDLSGVNLPAVEVIILLGNLLDNAISECVKVKEKGVQPVIKVTVTDEEQLVCSVKNPVSEDVKIVGNVVVKEYEPGHGLGLTNVRDVTEKYDGSFGINCDGDTFTATVVI